MTLCIRQEIHQFARAWMPNKSGSAYLDLLFRRRVLLEASGRLAVPRRVLIYWFRRPPRYPSCHPYAREARPVVGPLYYGVASPTRSSSLPNMPKVARAWCANNLARRSFRFIGFRRCDAARARAAWAVPRRVVRLLVSAALAFPSFTLTRTEGQAVVGRCYFTGSLANAIVAPKHPSFSRVGPNTLALRSLRN